jgi:hypothetical protein
MSSAAVADEDPTERQRRIRRSALLFGGIALAFYLAIIIMTLVRRWR